MSETTIAAEAREATGKNRARRLRAQGRIPAVLYGRGREPLALTTDPQALVRLLEQSDAGRNTLIDLKVTGGNGVGDVVVIVKELQMDPVAGKLLHADFNVVDLEHTIHVSVPVHLVGTPRGVTQDEGILDHTLREVEIECLPRAIPDGIEIDVAELGIDDSLHVSDLEAPEGAKILSDDSLSIVSVVAPRAVEEAVAAPEEAEEGAAIGEGEEEAKPDEAGPQDETKEEGGD